MKIVKMNKKNAQNMLEYILIFALVAVAACGFAMKFDFKTMRNYVFMRPVDSADNTKIKIEAMTNEN